MRLPVRALRTLLVTYSRSDVAAVSLIAGVVAAWAGIAGGAFSVRALVACEAAFFAFYLVGSVIGSVQSLSAGVLFDLPLRLLVGYLSVNTALFVLAWLSPLGMVANFCFVFGLALTLFFGSGKRERVAGSALSLGCVALCLAATTLWCQDSIRPRLEQGTVVLFKPWADGFYHAVHIRIFAESHGASTIEDWRLAGVAARPYHYGMYAVPAFIKQAAGIESYAAFAGLLAPVGVFFTGLAAYAFFGSLWGSWAGFAAACALLLLPDGAQQGMHNPFMSYHWLTQISPSATYGLAILVVAWLFVIKGCVQSSRLQLAMGWLFSGVVLAYKLHYVFASALLLLLVPAIFFQGRISVRKRVLAVVVAGGAYLVGLVLCQKVPGVPLIRFDGSAIGEILRLVESFAVPGALRDAVERRTGPQCTRISQLFFGVPYVLLATLGLFLPLLGLLWFKLRGRTPLLYVCFPLLLIANFLVMFFGLALDFSSSTPDELSHRPVMIVYFFVVTWVGGAAAFLLTGQQRLQRLARALLIGLSVVLLAVPATFGRGVQQMWAMPRNSPVRLPADLIRVADYIRSHGSSDEVFQHSQFDWVYAIAALSERRTFVAHTMTRMPFRGEVIDTRTAAIDHFMGLRNATAINATARAFGFRWFILERGDRVDWPTEIANFPVFEAGPFRLYEF
jgi:hypothetical protein